jgi:hypothetical protein
LWFVYLFSRKLTAGGNLAKNVFYLISAFLNWRHAVRSKNIWPIDSSSTWYKERQRHGHIGKVLVECLSVKCLLTKSLSAKNVESALHFTSLHQLFIKDFKVNKPFKIYLFNLDFTKI